MAAGLVTAALALAAHGLASGVAPSGAGTALLCVLAATVGAVAATTDRTSDVRVLLALLASGQLVAHLVLAVAGHHHSVHGPVCPRPVMLAAHTVALVVAAVLIATGDRLCRAVCTAIRDVVRQLPCPGLPVFATAGVPTACGDQPLRSALLLAASVSHRGPPVGLAR